LHEAEPRDGAECCLWIASQTEYVPVMVDPESIYHWHRLDDRITTSGQPSETQLADIAVLGVRYVINLGLHSHEKALPDEAATVDALDHLHGGRVPARAFRPATRAPMRQKRGRIPSSSFQLRLIGVAKVTARGVRLTSIPTVP
jgi:hypothetical protein